MRSDVEYLWERICIAHCRMWHNETARVHYGHLRCGNAAARRLGAAEQIISDRLSCLRRRSRLNHNHATVQELGYRQGENLEFVYRSADGRPELLASLAAELVNARPDVLISGFGTLPAKAAKAATNTIPTVFASVGDPVGAGLINSLNRPGGNVTGVTSEASDVVGKRLQLFDELLPGKGTVAVLMNPDTPFSTLALRELKTAAVAAEQPIQVFEARSADQVLAGVEAAAKAGAAGLLTLEDALLVSTRRQIAERAITTRLPIVYGSRAFPEAGGLISYGVDRRQMYRRAAEYVDMVLKGAKPAELPVEQPTKFELVINLNAAKAIGLAMPDKLLALADEVIE
jgi:putative ABC transport system substrate-binding protein